MPAKAAKKKNALNRKLSAAIENAIFIVILLICASNIVISTNQPQVLGASSEFKISFNQQELRDELKFWQEVSAAHPTYRDAYIEMSDIASKLGDTQKAIQYLVRAQKVDPH